MRVQTVEQAKLLLHNCLYTLISLIKKYVFVTKTLVTDLDSPTLCQSWSSVLQQKRDRQRLRVALHCNIFPLGVSVDQISL